MYHDTNYPAMEGDVKINSTKIAFRLVEELLYLNGARLADLTERMDKPTSTVHDHLTTLQDLGYVLKSDGEYTISSRFLEIGTRQRASIPIYDTAVTELDKLADRTSKHVNIMVEEYGEGVILYTSSGEGAPELDIHPTFPGTRTELHSTAPGKCILAYLSSERVDSMIETVGLPAFTDKTVTEREALERELQRIRERGYAYDRGERVVGLRAIGAPILDLDQNNQGAIAVYGPANQVEEGKFFEELPQQVLEIANVIKMNLNYSL